MVLEWTLSKRLGLAYSKIDLSLLQRQSASQPIGANCTDMVGTLTIRRLLSPVLPD